MVPFALSCMNTTNTVNTCVSQHAIGLVVLEEDCKKKRKAIQIQPDQDLVCGLYNM